MSTSFVLKIFYLPNPRKINNSYTKTEVLQRRSIIKGVRQNGRSERVI
jgi:hypothetical protein